MVYQVQDFEREYAGKANDELLRLASAPQDLVDGAKIALLTEMSRRGLKTADIETARFEDERRKEQLDLEAANRLLRLQWRGIGFQRFGKWDLTYDAESRTEEFTTTRFFELFYFPLIPIATYRVRRKRGIFQSIHVLKRIPLNWSQVLWVWMWALILTLAVVQLVKFGLPLLARR